MYGQISVIASQLDYDAQSFISAAGITDQTQTIALSNLVRRLKFFDVWKKCKAIYPFVGGTASTHKWNLKDPRDLDAAFRLVFNGGWTHSANGADPNGTTGYADTFFTPSTELSNTLLGHMSYYSRENTAPVNETVMGASNAAGSANLFFLNIRRFTNQRTFGMDTTTGTTYRWANDFNATDGRGYIVGTQQGADVKYFRNGTLQMSNSAVTVNSAIANQKVFIAALNFGGTAGNFADKQCAFATIGEALTDTDCTQLYNAVNEFQITLGRNV